MLVIDQGNSVCKWAFFRNPGPASSAERPMADQTPSVFYTQDPDELLAKKIFDQYQAGAAIYSSVLNQADESKFRALQTMLPLCIRFDSHTPIPIQNNYHQAEKLGADRLAAAVGAWTLAPGKSSLIIDLGTAITYDLLSADGVYEGGNIAPGIYLRMKTLHENTGALPMPNVAVEDFPAFGRDTLSAIQAGVYQGIFHEINGYIRQHQGKYPDLTIFLTGGDLIYFVKKLKSGIFARPNLVLTGLFRILSDYVNA